LAAFAGSSAALGTGVLEGKQSSINASTTMSFRPEDVDLADLTEALERELDGNAPVGYAEGKTALRDLVVGLLECSELEAEQVVDTMVARGFLRFSGDPSAPIDDGLWSVDTSV
jgi:hypothetical protein